MFGQFYLIRIRLDYTMKMLGWIRIAKIFDPFNTTTRSSVEMLKGYMARERLGNPSLVKPTFFIQRCCEL